jgi:hypothetical protein
MPTWKLTIEYKGTRYLAGKSRNKAAPYRARFGPAAEDYFGEKSDLGGSGRTTPAFTLWRRSLIMRAVKKRSTEPIQAALTNGCPPTFTF